MVTGSSLLLGRLAAVDLAVIQAAEIPAGQCSLVVHNPLAAPIYILFGAGLPAADMYDLVVPGRALMAYPLPAGAALLSARVDYTGALPAGDAGQHATISVTGTNQGTFVAAVMAQAAPFRSAATTFRTLGDGTVRQSIMSLEGLQGGLFIALRRARLSMDATAILATVGVTAMLRRVTPMGGGTLLTETALDARAGAPYFSVFAVGATAGDGGPATPINNSPAGALRQGFLGRQISASGAYHTQLALDLWTPADPPLIIPGPAAVTIEVRAVAGLDNPATNNYLAEMEWEEYPP